jgi:hypothetical protein
MPFCNHCGEILTPGTISCPTCGQDPGGSSLASIRDAAGLHAKLEIFTNGRNGIRRPGKPSADTIARTKTGTPAGDDRPERGPEAGDIRRVRTRRKNGLIPAPPLSLEPIRLTVTPSVPGYDPNPPGPRPEPPVERASVDDGPGQEMTEQTSEDMIEEFLQTDVGLTDTQRKVKYMLGRAMDHVQRARTYRAMRKKHFARDSYQRALNYYERAVTLDPANVEAKKGRQECLTRISM